MEFSDATHTPHPILKGSAAEHYLSLGTDGRIVLGLFVN